MTGQAVRVAKNIGDSSRTKKPSDTETVIRSTRCGRLTSVSGDGRHGRRRFGSGAAPPVDEMAAGEPGGNQSINFRITPELDGEIVQLIEKFGDFTGLGEKLRSERVALADGIDGCGDDVLAVVRFLGQLGDGGGSDTVTGGGSCGASGGEGSGIGSEQAGFVDQHFFAKATPVADLEVVFRRGGEVLGVVAKARDGVVRASLAVAWGFGAVAGH